MATRVLSFRVQHARKDVCRSYLSRRRCLCLCIYSRLFLHVFRRGFSFSFTWFRPRGTSSRNFHYAIRPYNISEEVYGVRRYLVVLLEVGIGVNGVQIGRQLRGEFPNAANDEAGVGESPATFSGRRAASERQAVSVPRASREVKEYLTAVATDILTSGCRTCRSHLSPTSSSSGRG